MSPYPTVVIVITTHHKELNRGSIASKFESLVEILLKYGISNILSKYVYKKTERTKNRANVCPGLSRIMHLNVNLTPASKPYDLQSFLEYASV